MAVLQGSAKSFSAEKKSRSPFFLTFFVMAGFWVVFSGRFDAFHLSLGAISCALVSYFSSDFLFSPQTTAGSLAKSWYRFIIYTPWLIKEIIVANIWLLYLAFHPRMMELIDPQVMKFKSYLQSDMALLTFANSITLTPGTITAHMSVDGRFTVHAIDGKSASGLPGEMQDKIAKAFGEDKND